MRKIAAEILPMHSRNFSRSRRLVLAAGIGGLYSAGMISEASEVKPEVRLSSILKPGSRFYSANELEVALSKINDLRSAVVVDGVYKFSGVLKLPKNIKLIGRSADATLMHDGRGPAIVVTSECYIDGITIDGGRSSDSRIRSQQCSLISIYSPKFPGDGVRLRGVKIGKLVIVNTNCLAAITLANLEQCKVENLLIHDCWGHGLLAFGLHQSIISNFYSKNIGNLSRSGSRLGSAIALFSERSPGKSPGDWYIVGSEAETDGVIFENVECHDSTDTAIYIHGYPDKASVKNITFGKVLVDGAGKDGFKIRLHASNVFVSNAEVKNVALRGVSVEQSNNIQFDKLVIENVGVDISPRAGLRPVFDEKNSESQSIIEMPVGILLLEANDVIIKSAIINRVFLSPISKKYGIGVYGKNSKSVEVTAQLSATQGASVYLENLESANFDIESKSETCPRIILRGGYGPKRTVSLKVNGAGRNLKCIERSGYTDNVVVRE